MIKLTEQAAKDLAALAIRHTKLTDVLRSLHLYEDPRHAIRQGLICVEAHGESFYMPVAVVRSALEAEIKAINDKLAATGVALAESDPEISLNLNTM